jgi:putative ABC transport system permease protein
VLTLALGIGANSGIFSVLNGVILRPLPYPQPEQLVRVFSAFSGTGMERFWLSGPEYFELKERMRSFPSAGSFQLGTASVGGDEMPVRAAIAWITNDVFDVLGVGPQLGRIFDEAEATGQGERSAVISHGLWQRAFGGDAGIVGRTVPVNSIETRVIGVMRAAMTSRSRASRSTCRRRLQRRNQVHVPRTTVTSSHGCARVSRCRRRTRSSRSWSRAGRS